jgi:hypothetical protein
LPLPRSISQHTFIDVIFTNPECVH